MNEPHGMDDRDEAQDVLEPAAPDKATRRSIARERILRSTAVLPSFVTILNGLAGLGAIHFATKEALGDLSAANMTNLQIAAWLIALAMLFDMLDGRLARLTRRTSDFGGQLDSLCDVISFGVAPAILTLRAVVPTLRGIGELGYDWNLERVVWSVAAVYVACTVLRLARFNVENEPDESAHMDFRGLPSPGAASVIASLILLFEHLTRLVTDWESKLWFLLITSAVLLAATLASGLLMVSRFKYAHLVNHWVRGRRPFSYLVKLVLIVLALWWKPFATLALAGIIYMASGPIRAAWVHVRTTRAAAKTADPGGSNDESQ